MEIDLNDLKIALKIEGGSLVATLQYKGEVISQDRVSLPRIPEPTFGPLHKQDLTLQPLNPEILRQVKELCKTDARSAISIDEQGKVINQAPHRVF